MFERKGDRLGSEVRIDSAESRGLVGSVGDVNRNDGRTACRGDGGAAAAEACVGFSADDWGGEVLPGVNGVGGCWWWRTVCCAAATGASHCRRLVSLCLPSDVGLPAYNTYLWV